MYKLINVGKQFWDGHRLKAVLNGVNLEIDEGDMISVVGSSGSGKSTLLSLLGLIDYHTCGQVLFDGMDTSALKDWQLADIRSKNIGYIPQNNYLIDFLTVFENVISPMLMKGISKYEAVKRTEAALEKVRIDRSLFASYPNTLSGGEKQRVSIARVLAMRPRIILADEPTGNLDDENAEIVFENIKMLNEEGIAIVMVTHNNELAARYPRQITIENKGLVEYKNPGR